MQNIYAHKENVFFLNALRISLAPTPREVRFHVMFVRTHTYFETQDATKITSALADSRIYSSWTMVSFLVKTLCLCLTFMTMFLSVSPFSPSFVTMSSPKPIGVDRVNRWTRNSAQRLENHNYDSLAFSRHNIDLVFDEETRKPERLTEAPEKSRY